jgi:hypothetical protein
LPVFLIAIYASSFPRSGAMYVVISRATHPFLGFLPNWLWIISTGFSVGFLNYIMLNILASCLQVAGEISNSAGLMDTGEWLTGNYTRLYIALIATVVIWFFELHGMDRLKWFIRIVVYVPCHVNRPSPDGRDRRRQSLQRHLQRRCTRGPACGPSWGSGRDPTWGGISGMLMAIFWATRPWSRSIVGSEVKTPRTALRGMSIASSPSWPVCSTRGCRA